MHPADRTRGVQRYASSSTPGGRPKETVELKEDVTERRSIDDMSLSELVAERERILDAHPELRQLTAVPEREQAAQHRMERPSR